jgi:hypothetical protein
MNHISPKTLLLLSSPQVLLIVVSGCIALFTPGFYNQATPNWQTQTIGQDIIDVFLISPVLIISAVVAAYRNKKALYIWGGVNLYLVYTFTIYCFAVHFNQLFIVYCIILGLSFYSLLLFLFWLIKEKAEINFHRFYPFRLTAIYFIIIAGLFYFLWLAEIVPALIRNETPATLREVGLFTNPVHVIDLAILLPSLFITGILILKRRTPGYQFAPAMLSFLVLMDITIGFLAWLMKERGVGGNLSLVIVMGVLAIFSALLLVSCLRSLAVSREAIESESL